MSHHTISGPQRAARIAVTMAFVVAVTPLLGSAADESPLPYPHPDRSDLNRYMVEAERFLNERGDSPYAPRVAIDMLIVAGAAGQTPAVEKVKRLLIMRYPTSLEASYAVSTFADAAAYREFLTNTPDDVMDKLLPAYSRFMYPAVKLGLKRFGADVLKDVSFCLKAALAAHDSGDVQFRDQVLRLVDTTLNPSDEQKAVVELAFRDTRVLSQRVADLHAIDHADAKFFTRYALANLPDAERSAQPVVRIRADQALGAHRWREALELIATLDDDDADPQLLLWRGWCHVALDEAAEATKLLARVQEAHPDSDWAKVAATLHVALPGLDEAIGHNAQAIAAAVRRANAGVEMFEARLKWTPPGAPSADVYFGKRGGAKAIELIVRVDEKVVLAYRADEQAARVYFADEDRIYAAPGKGAIFIPRLDITPKPDGSFNFHFSGQMGSSVEQAVTSAGAVLDSPFLSTAPGAAQLLRSLIRRNRWVPVGGRFTEDNGGELTWVRIDLHDPAQTQRVTIRVSGDGEIESITGRDGAALTLRYSDQHDPNPPAWPNVEVRQTTPQNMSILFISKLIPAVFKMQQDADAAALPGVPGAE